jgi:hypothetical protein
MIRKLNHQPPAFARAFFSKLLGSKQKFDASLGQLRF